jgi:hypothetical protein
MWWKHFVLSSRISAAYPHSVRAPDTIRWHCSDILNVLRTSDVQNRPICISKILSMSLLSRCPSTVVYKLSVHTRYFQWTLRAFSPEKFLSCVSPKSWEMEPSFSGKFNAYTYRCLAFRLEALFLQNFRFSFRDFGIWTADLTCLRLHNWCGKDPFRDRSANYQHFKRVCINILILI